METMIDIENQNRQELWPYSKFVRDLAGVLAVFALVLATLGLMDTMYSAVFNYSGVYDVLRNASGSCLMFYLGWYFWHIHKKGQFPFSS